MIQAGYVAGGLRQALCFSDVVGAEKFKMAQDAALDHHLEPVLARQRSGIGPKCLFKQAVAGRSVPTTGPIGMCS
jgi:hypothetical protein